MLHTRALTALALSLAACAFACVTPAVHVADAPVLEGVKNDGAEMMQVRGAWLRVRETPEPAVAEGPPVVFVHGFGSRLESFKIVQPALSATRRTLSYDQRGFGLSERTGGEYGPESHAADLESLLNQRGIDRAVLVGHSYGAGVVLRFALRHPDRVAGIVLVSPFALDEQVVTAFRWAKVPGLGEYLFAASWRGFAGEKYLLAFHDPLRTSPTSGTTVTTGSSATHGAPREKPRLVSSDVLDEVEGLQNREGSAFAQLATVRGMDYADVEETYRSIAAPITLVWGTQDRITPFSMSPKFLEKLPNAKLVQIPAVGHMPSWEAPSVLVEAIRTVGTR